MQALTLRQLLERADEVVCATVIEQQSVRDRHGRIVTDVRLRIDETMQGTGEVGQERVVRRLGGGIGNDGMVVPGAAIFDDGEQVVVFMESRDGHLRVVGMSQGRMPIRTLEGGEPMVLPGGTGASLLQRSPSGAMMQARPALIQPEPLSLFITRVRALSHELRAE